MTNTFKIPNASALRIPSPNGISFARPIDHSFFIIQTGSCRWIQRTLISSVIRIACAQGTRSCLSAQLGNALGALLILRSTSFQFIPTPPTAGKAPNPITTGISSIDQPRVGSRKNAAHRSSLIEQLSVFLTQPLRSDPAARATKTINHLPRRFRISFLAASQSVNC